MVFHFANFHQSRPLRCGILDSTKCNRSALHVDKVDQTFRANARIPQEDRVHLKESGTPWMMNIGMNPFPSSFIARQYYPIHCSITHSYVAVMNNDNTMIGLCLLTCGIDYLHCATKVSRAAACVANFLASFAGSPHTPVHPMMST